MFITHNVIARQVMLNDANEDVDVLVTREDDMGLRSSMVGDQFVIEATSGDRSLHEVGMFGFKSLVA